MVPPPAICSFWSTGVAARAGAACAAIGVAASPNAAVAANIVLAIFIITSVTSVRPQTSPNEQSRSNWKVPYYWGYIHRLSQDFKALGILLAPSRAPVSASAWPTARAANLPHLP